MTDQYLGLHRGPIEHASSSVLNIESGGPIEMGATVEVSTTVFSTETLPRVAENTVLGGSRAYGIAVGGDNDGTYGDGAISSNEAHLATTTGGQGVVVVTQGRCKAQIAGTVIIGDKLTGTADGRLIVATTTQYVIATALQAGAINDMIAVDVQREGLTAAA